MIPRLHQSIAKVLIQECPAAALAVFEEERRRPSRAMERGTLVDQLVFGGADFHIIDAIYKSGKRKGQPVDNMAGGNASEQAEAARERGQVPCLPHEYEAAKRRAGRIKARLLEEGIDLSKCQMQQEVEWIGSTGCPCAGKPDLVTGLVTVDLKDGYSANPDKIDHHVFEMGYHIQGAAYQEAVGGKGQHFLVCSEYKSGADMVSVLPFSIQTLYMGREDWVEAQLIWMKCWETNTWPEYTQRPICPPRSVMIKRGILQ